MAHPQFRLDADVPGRPTILLAHGAGAAMDTPFMSAIAGGLAAEGLRVARFEFAYMAARRDGGPRRPPPRVEHLAEEYRAALAALPVDGPVVIGGKSLGGRVASLVADDLLARDAISGLVCLGYPFHPQGKPERTRTAHLAELRTPCLICQGTRDPFGTRAEVESYALSSQIKMLWLDDGDHDLKPRKTVTGLSQSDHLATACRGISAWIGDSQRLPD